MSPSLRAGALAAAVAAALTLTAAGPAAAAPSWRLEQPAPPAGHGSQPLPLGVVSDLQFLAPNRGLLQTSGTDVVPAGLYAYDGRSWHPYATVCGASGSGRIAWAGPTEFWTVSDTALPPFATKTLCHFAGGKVVTSYATPDGAEDSYTLLAGAACTAPTDCWFGGTAQRSATGLHTGTFHLHWDGARMTLVDGPEGRGVSDMVATGGGVLESLVAGAAVDNDAAPVAAPAGPPHPLQHLLPTGGVTADPFTVAPDPDGGYPLDGTDVLALGADATQVWAAGGGSNSGVAGRGDEPVERPPFLARAVTGGAFAELTPTLPDGTTPSYTARVTDVAPIPGTDQAWALLKEYSIAGSNDARAQVVRVDATGQILETDVLPATGQVLGDGWRITCAAPENCWMATTRGWLYHWSDPDAAPLAQDTDPAMTTLVTSRPADARTPQYTPDALPIDDSGAYVAPTVELLPAPDNGVIDAQGKKLRALMAKVKSQLLKGNVLRISFDLRRRARVGLVAYKKGKVVGHAKVRTLKPGRRAIQVKLSRKHWPSKLRFQTRELTKAGIEAAKNKDAAS